MAAEQIPTLHQHDTSSSDLARLVREKKLSLHPLSLIAFFLWTAFTAALVFILEYAVSHPKLSLSPSDNTVMIWLKAPGLLITVFAQGHAFITAWHLGRLGISSVNNRQLGPRTYLEMFWLSNKEWKNPLWLKTFWSAKKRHGEKLRMSLTFIMFVFAFIVALPTPILLRRAYAITPINLNRDYPYNSSISSLFPNASNALDPYTQLNIGQTAWASGFSVADTYPFRVYYPSSVDLFLSAGQSSILNDVMFSADMDPGAYARLPGTRVQSACAIEDIDNFNLTLEAGGYVPKAFLDLCDHEGLKLQSEFQWGPGMNMTFAMGFCHNLPTTNPNIEDQGLVYWNASAGADRDETALIWLNLSDYTQTPATQGVVRCNMSITDSIAQLWLDFDSGSVQFSNLTQTQLFKQNTSRPEVPYWPPLLTALNTLSLPVNTSTTDGDNVDIAASEPFISRGKMFGYTLTDTWDGPIQLYRKPSLEDATTALQSGALHMAAAINIGASTIQQQELTFRLDDSWWTRDLPYRLCTFVLLGVWFGAMLGLTICLYRPAFASSMDSYAIAQLCAEHPELFETRDDGHANPHKNPRMLTSLGSTDPDSRSNIEEYSDK